jgi:hypothetical protein
MKSNQLINSVIWINLILLIINQNCVDAEPVSFLAVLAITKKIVMSIALLWTIVDKSELSNKYDIPFMKNNDKKIFKGMEEISGEIKNLEVTVGLLETPF